MDSKNLPYLALDPILFDINPRSGVTAMTSTVVSIIQRTPPWACRFRMGGRNPIVKV